MDLVEKELGSEGDLELDLVEGKLVLRVSHKSKGLEAGLSAKVDSDYFLDKLAALIPGEFDDAMIAALKLALKAMSPAEPAPDPA